MKLLTLYEVCYIRQLLPGPRVHTLSSAPCFLAASMHFFFRAQFGIFNSKQNIIFQEDQMLIFNIITCCYTCFMLATVFRYKLINLKSNIHYGCGYWILNLFVITSVGIVSQNKLSLFPAAFLK